MPHDCGSIYRRDNDWYLCVSEIAAHAASDWVCTVGSIRCVESRWCELITAAWLALTDSGHGDCSVSATPAWPTCTKAGSTLINICRVSNRSEAERWIEREWHNVERARRSGPVSGIEDTAVRPHTHNSRRLLCPSVRQSPWPCCRCNRLQQLLVRGAGTEWRPRPALSLSLSVALSRHNSRSTTSSLDQLLLSPDDRVLQL